MSEDEASAESECYEAPASGPLVALRRHFDDWLRGLDIAKMRTTITTKMFVGIFVQGLALILVASYLPGARDFFELEPLPALVWLLLATAPGFVMGHLEPRGRLSMRLFGVLSLLGSCFFQAFAWVLVGATRLPGSALLAALPIILVAFHGHLYQSGLQRPLPLVAALLAIAAVFVIHGDQEHAVVFGVAAPLALGTHLLFGYQARLDQLARNERDALRAALEAQVLRERTADLGRLSEEYDELRGRLHDAGNLLASVMLGLPELVRAFEAVGTNAGDVRGARRLVDSLAERLRRLSRLMSTHGRVAAQKGLEPTLVRPWLIVVRAAETVRRMQSDVRFVLSTPSSPDAVVAMHGGSEALERAVFNVLLNACEGNGKERATRVHVSMSESTTNDEIVLHVSDDGPGFEPSLLESALNQPRTTKPTGSGLGLYTSSRVLAASAARLTRTNRASRGALVSIVMPRQDIER